MARLKWEIIHECDDENDNPTQWCTQINHPDYGKYCWISDESFDTSGRRFVIEVNIYSDNYIELARCKSLASAKRWVAEHLV